MANSVGPDQSASIGAVCSGSTLFASLLNSSVLLGNYLQQTASADDIFRCIFSWRFKGKHPIHFHNFLMEQVRIEHAPNGSLLTYITIAEGAIVNKKQ